MADGAFDWIVALLTNLGNMLPSSKAPRFRGSHGALEITDDDGQITWRG